tara:strand:- start:2 stop:229 length:228 start_codon:yes stop_codon:yes gene_type:complete
MSSLSISKSAASDYMSAHTMIVDGKQRGALHKGRLRAAWQAFRAAGQSPCNRRETGGKRQTEWSGVMGYRIEVMG